MWTERCSNVSQLVGSFVWWNTMKWHMKSRWNRYDVMVMKMLFRILSLLYGDGQFFVLWCHGDETAMKSWWTAFSVIIFRFKITSGLRYCWKAAVRKAVSFSFFFFFLYGSVLRQSFQQWGTYGFCLFLFWMCLWSWHYANRPPGVVLKWNFKTWKS